MFICTHKKAYFWKCVFLKPESSGCHVLLSYSGTATDSVTVFLFHIGSKWFSLFQVPQNVTGIGIGVNVGLNQSSKHTLTFCQVSALKEGHKGIGFEFVRVWIKFMDQASGWLLLLECNNVTIVLDREEKGGVDPLNQADPLHSFPPL